jgi:hypothetical protein
MPTRPTTAAQRNGRARPRGPGRAGDCRAPAPLEEAEILDQSSPEVGHAGLLSAQRFGRPDVDGQQVRLVRSLQPHYGNEYVGRVLGLARQSGPSRRSSGLRSGATDLTVQRSVGGEGSAAGEVLESAVNVSPSDLPREVTAATAAQPGLAASEKSTMRAGLPAIPRPTGLPPRSPSSGRPALPTSAGPSAVPTSAPTTGAGPAPGPVGAGPFGKLSQHANSALASVPGSEGPAGGGIVAEHDGDADPARNRVEHRAAIEHLAGARAQGDTATTQDFGEKAVFPTAPAETLKPNVVPTPPAGSSRGALPSLVVPGPARAVLDRYAAPALHAKGTHRNNPRGTRLRQVGLWRASVRGHG